MGAFVLLSFVPSPVVIVNAKSLTLYAFPHAAEKNINNRRHFKKLFLAKVFAFCKVQLSNTGSRTGGVSPWSPQLEDLDKYEQNRSSVIPLPAFPRHPESQHGRPASRLTQMPSPAPSLHSLACQECWNCSPMTRATASRTGERSPNSPTRLGWRSQRKKCEKHL